MSSTKEAKKAAEIINDASEAGWATELGKQFQGETEPQVLQMTDSSGRLVKAMDCYIYFYGKDHVIFEQFVTRGTTEKSVSSKSSSISSAEKKNVKAVESEELDMDMDWEN